MRENSGGGAVAVPRLCGEIQLFDLCDLNVCTYKAERFCTNADLLARFERISEDEQRPLIQAFPDEELDEDMAADDDGSLVGFDLDEERDAWEDE